MSKDLTLSICKLFLKKVVTTLTFYYESTIGTDAVIDMYFKRSAKLQEITYIMLVMLVSAILRKIQSLQDSLSDMYINVYI